MRFRHTALLLGGLVLMGLVAACGGSPAATPTPTPQAQAPTPTPTAQAPAQTTTPQAANAPAGFGQSFNQIVQLAEQETAKDGPMKFCVSDETTIAKEQITLFENQFPKIPVLETEQCNNTPPQQKILLELQAGKVSQDMFEVGLPLYQQFVSAKVLAGPFNFQALGFPASWGLQNTSSAYPAPGYGISQPFSADVPGIIFNTSLVPAADYPKSLADCLNPYWSGKFAVNATPREFAYFGLPQLSQTWGLQKVLDYSKKLAANNPIWASSVGDEATKVIAGQLAMECGDIFYDQIFHVPPAQLGNTIRVIIPNDLGSTVAGIYLNPNVIAKDAKEPNAALLYAAFQVSTPANTVMMNDPQLKWKVPSSVPGSALGQLLQQQGLKVVDVTSQSSKLADIEKQIEAAEGFPTAQ